MTTPRVNAVTFVVRTGDGPDAVAWCSRLLGRGPDVNPGADLRAAVASGRADGVAVEDPEVLPGTVAWTDLSDPWGNPLGLFQEPAGSS